MGDPNPLDYQRKSRPSTDDRIALWVNAIFVGGYFGTTGWFAYKAADVDGMAALGYVIVAVPTTLFGMIHAWLLYREIGKSKRR